MAGRGWGGSIAVAVGVAAGASAAQLGLGYGLGIMAWQPVDNASSESVWLASLAWSTWVAATSAIAGAVVADRLSAGAIGDAPPRVSYVADGVVRQPPRRIVNVAWRFALAVAAALGALLTVPLISIPARAATRADNYAPQVVAGWYAAVGVLVGLLIAASALASRAVATNVLSSVVWVWVLAGVAVTDGVASGQGLHTAQLGVWRFGDHGKLFREAYDLNSGILMLAAALVIGALAALPAARRGDGQIGIAISGAVGPLLVAGAYLLAGPKLLGVRAEQLSALLISPYAMITGLAGSVLIATLAHRPGGHRSAALATADGAGDPYGWSDAAGAGDLGRRTAAPQPRHGAGPDATTIGMPVPSGPDPGGVPAGSPGASALTASGASASTASGEPAGRTRRLFGRGR